MFLFAVAIPLVVVGQGTQIQNPLNVDNIPELIDNIISYLQRIAFYIAPVMLIIAGFMYYFDGGKAENAKKATAIIKWTVVGLAIVIIANGIASIVAGIMGVSIDNARSIIDSLWS